MLNIDTFAVIGGDLRSAYLAGLLAADGYKVITSGFDSTDLPPCVTGCTNPAQAVTLADCVILPLPVTTDGTTVNAPFSRMRIPLDQVLNGMAQDQFLVGEKSLTWCEKKPNAAVWLFRIIFCGKSWRS